MCTETATYRMFWSGSQPSYICTEHAEKGRRIGQIMGYYIHFEPVTDDEEHQCETKTKG